MPKTKTLIIPLNPTSSDSVGKEVVQQLTQEAGAKTQTSPFGLTGGLSNDSNESLRMAVAAASGRSAQSASGRVQGLGHYLQLPILAHRHLVLENGHPSQSQCMPALSFVCDLLCHTYCNLQCVVLIAVTSHSMKHIHSIRYIYLCNIFITPIYIT